LISALLLQGEARAQDEQVVHFEDFKPLYPEKPQLLWDELTSWTTPDAQFFSVAHYGNSMPFENT
jgi:hypothetical protein